MNHTDNQRWVLRRRPESAPGPDDLEFVSSPVDELGDEQILVKNLLLSLDPTNRLWMSDRDQYLPPVEIGEIMRGTTIGVVEQSRSDRFDAGDTVLLGEGGWQTHSVAPGSAARRLRPVEGLPLQSHLSVLGMTGLTAYVGLLDICQPREGETLVVSAAAGAVGSVVGQIAKIKGCRVIGIAGGPDKCRWIVDELGFDGAIDYKSEAVGDALDRLCPDGIDMDFENVGGPIMDAVFSRLNKGGRMALCGMISGYNTEGPLAGPTDFGRVLMNRLTIRGFVVIDHLDRSADARRDLVQWITDGKITWKDHIVDGLENATDALSRLFSGAHDGKLLVRVAQ
ncbi:NADP-dependent oxidoreductase [Nocardia sp. 348MFTsu5.1]|uniref:NADP-dependent oxidoreductase n=1 Tax=Nocardia sp. 348MFTsu5.1 TaxID=1172185 RepID=UPI000361E2F9|nr:NADP-dependent oxidoreductase [Nocardia sp. 348MFTsu5.1]